MLKLLKKASVKHTPKDVLFVTKDSTGKLLLLEKGDTKKSGYKHIIKNGKKTIMLDYLSGPIWTNYIDDETLNKITGVPIVDNDEIIKDLNKKISDIYSLCYEFNTKGGFKFNYNREKKNKQILLSLLHKLIDRLNLINDGSYIVEDKETARISNIIFSVYINKV